MSNHPLEQSVQEGSLFGSETLLEQSIAELPFESEGWCSIGPGTKRLHQAWILEPRPVSNVKWFCGL